MNGAGEAVDGLTPLCSSIDRQCSSGHQCSCNGGSPSPGRTHAGTRPYLLPQVRLRPLDLQLRCGARQRLH